MDDYQRDWIIYLTPFLLLYSIKEVKRGWNILMYQKYSLNFAYAAQIWLVKLLQGDERSVEYKENLLNNADQMKQSGYYSLIGGILVMVVCIFWIYLLIRL